MVVHSFTSFWELKMNSSRNYECDHFQKQFHCSIPKDPMKLLLKNNHVCVYEYLRDVSLTKLDLDINVQHS